MRCSTVADLAREKRCERGAACAGEEMDIRIASAAVLIVTSGTTSPQSLGLHSPSSTDCEGDERRGFEQKEERSQTAHKPHPPKMSIAGFDVGNDTSVVALARRKGIDVVSGRPRVKRRVGACDGEMAAADSDRVDRTREHPRSTHHHRGDVHVCLGGGDGGVASRRDDPARSTKRGVVLAGHRLGSTTSVCLTRSETAVRGGCTHSR